MASEPMAFEMEMSGDHKQDSAGGEQTVTSLWAFCSPIPALITDQRLQIWIRISLFQNLIFIIEMLLHIFRRTQNIDDLEENRTSWAPLSFFPPCLHWPALNIWAKIKTKKWLEWLQCYLVNERKREVYFYRANSKHNLTSNTNFCFVDYFNMTQNE